MTWRRNALVLALVLVLAGYAVYQNIDKKHKEEAALAAERGLGVNTTAPGFTLKGLDGETYTAGGERDKPMMINFWASWCGPCAEEAPDLVKVYEKYKGQFDLYAVNVTPGDKMDNIRKFVQDNGYPFPVLLDEQGEVAEQYRFIVIPTSFLVDKHGVIREVINVLPQEQLEAKIKKLIAS